jgi:hypothetical protein
MEIIKDKTLKEQIAEIYGETVLKGLKFTLNQAAKLVSRSTSVLSWDIDRKYLPAVRDEKDWWEIDGEKLVDWYSIRPDFRTSLGKAFRARLDAAILANGHYVLDEVGVDKYVVKYGLERADRDANERATILFELSLIAAAAVLSYCHSVERKVTYVTTSISRSLKRIVGGANAVKAYVIT